MPGGDRLSELPFLTVVTRHCHGREELLARNQESLRRQSDQDFEQVLIVDDTPWSWDGLNEADRSFVGHTNRVRGEYVYILDDDDLLVGSDFVREVKRVAREYNPDVIMVRVQRTAPGFLGEILPCSDAWGSRPLAGHVGAPCFVVRRVLWVEHIWIFGDPGKLPTATSGFGDCEFVRHLYDLGCSFYWLDRIVATVNRIGHKEER